MKITLKIIFVFFILTTPIFGAEIPRLVLYFDINKTLIASDKATNRSIDNILNELLAEKHVAVWDENEEYPISFEDYAAKMTDSRENKIIFVHHFIDFLKEHNHPLHPNVLHDYVSALTAINASEGTVFTSFYSLLNFLDQEKIPYSIILRSFGREVMEVKEEIEKIHQMVFDIGKFQQGSLVLETGAIFTDAPSIYQLLKSSSHVAIQDDWTYWNAHRMASAKGKPFYVNQEDDEILPIFFDDNIHLKDSYTNIIAPLNALTGELISIEELVGSGKAVRVNTWDAILDQNYYIDLVKIAINKNGCLVH
jgi:hypothetical protein